MVSVIVNANCVEFFKVKLFEKIYLCFKKGTTFFSAIYFHFKEVSLLKQAESAPSCYILIRNIWHTMLYNITVYNILI